jgi:hypothetical protein
MDYETRRTLPNLGPLVGSIDEWLQIAREVIPFESKKIDGLLEELVDGRLDAFDRLMAQNEVVSKEL